VFSGGGGTPFREVKWIDLIHPLPSTVVHFHFHWSHIKTCVGEHRHTSELKVRTVWSDLQCGLASMSAHLSAHLCACVCVCGVCMEYLNEKRVGGDGVKTVSERVQVPGHGDCHVCANSCFRPPP
jgi:hypothetical protein